MTPYTVYVVEVQVDGRWLPVTTTGSLVEWNRHYATVFLTKHAANAAVAQVWDQRDLSKATDVRVVTLVTRKPRSKPNAKASA